MSIRVYRVQDAEGRGPFRPGFSKQWIDAEDAPGMKALPAIQEEFGPEVFSRMFRHEYYGTAVRSPDRLAKWFSASEQKRLAEYGYKVVALQVNEIIAESDNQLVFARRKHLAKDVVVVPWPSLEAT